MCCWAAARSTGPACLLLRHRGKARPVAARAGGACRAVPRLHARWFASSVVHLERCWSPHPPARCWSGAARWRCASTRARRWVAPSFPRPLSLCRATAVKSRLTATLSVKRIAVPAVCVKCLRSHKCTCTRTAESGVCAKRNCVCVCVSHMCVCVRVRMCVRVRLYTWTWRCCSWLPSHFYTSASGTNKVDADLRGAHVDPCAQRTWSSLSIF